MMELLFSRNEFASDNISNKRLSYPEVLEHKDIEEVIFLEEKEETKIEEKQEGKKPNKKRGGKASKFPVGFSLYYKAYIEKKMTTNQIAEKIGVNQRTIYNYIKKYEKMKEDNTYTNV